MFIGLDFLIGCQANLHSLAVSGYFDGLQHRRRINTLVKLNQEERVDILRLI